MKYTAEFIKEVLAAAQTAKIPEVAKRFNVWPPMIYKWKKQSLNGIVTPAEKPKSSSTQYQEYWRKLAKTRVRVLQQLSDAEDRGEERPEKTLTELAKELIKSESIESKTSPQTG